MVPFRFRSPGPSKLRVHMGVDLCRLPVPQWQRLNFFLNTRAVPCVGATVCELRPSLALDKRCEVRRHFRYARVVEFLDLLQPP